MKTFTAFIEWRGIVPGPQESLREAFARALEISCSELDEKVAEGITPMHKFLADHDSWRRSKPEKAVRRWPSG